MREKKKILKCKYFYFLSLIIFGLIAFVGIGCGGNNNESTSDDISQTLQGRFIDAPVQGINYVSGSENGITDPNGQFIYEVGKTVTFFIGDIQLGNETTGKEVITPVDLVENGSLYNIEVVNISRFLQSLDSDFSDNKITIPESVRITAKDKDLDFSNSYSFDTTAQDLIDNLTEGYPSTISLVNSITAQQHLDNVFTELGLITNTQGGWKLIKYEEDSENDGIIEKICYQTYDSNGNMVKEIENDGGEICIEYFTYDTSGNPTREDGDTDNNGTIDRIIYYTYGDNGKITKDEWDWGVNGTIDIICYYTYDNDGNETKEEEDKQNDGTIDEITYYTYNDSGNMMKEECDEGNDGIMDEITYYIYDGISKVGEAEYNDGTVAYCTLDTNGNITKVERDDGNDDTIDCISIFYWEQI